MNFAFQYANVGIGGSICGLFLIAGLLSVGFYKPWRRRIDRRRASLVTSNSAEDEFERSLALSDRLTNRRCSLQEIMPEARD
jgi:hypothetical protein